ncbi:hypothetical protein CDAR_542281 [Caerostris darwini]|uniref:Uncharacterized protein n=1 Tax=Caerostris darwini TaxID=1538125 RepID=A0AAV4PI14_9ARAC|nr:hypothetical protein CDAR_542281 [Caerostris darwini]
MKELALLFSRAEIRPYFPRDSRNVSLFFLVYPVSSPISASAGAPIRIYGFYPIFRLSAIAYCRVYWSLDAGRPAMRPEYVRNQKSAQGTELGS